MLSLNVSGNLGPKRIAGALKQKIVHMIHVAGINLRASLLGKLLFESQHEKLI